MRFFEAEGHVAVEPVRRTRREGRRLTLRAGVLAPLAAGLTFALLGEQTYRGPSEIAVFASLAIGSAMLMAVRRGWSGRRRQELDFRPAKVRVVADTMHLSGDLDGTFAAESFVDGWVRADETLVLRKADDVAVVVSGLAQGQAARLLACLGLDSRRRALTFTVRGPAMARSRSARAVGLVALVLSGLLLGTVLFMFGWIAPDAVLTAPGTDELVDRLGLLSIFVAVPWALAHACYLLVADRELRLGTDGFQLPGLWRDRFVRFANIDRVEDDLGVHLRDGGHLRLRGFDEREHEDLSRRLVEAVARTQESAARTDVDSLKRQDRSVREWKRALNRLSDEETDYRHARWLPETLAEVTADPAQPPDVRLGAAMAAADAGGEEIRERLRIAAGASADPDLSAALEAIADDADAADELVERTLRRSRERHAAKRFQSGWRSHSD